MSYAAVFLDLDNTLYPYAPCNEAGMRSAQSTFREHGYDVDRARFDALYGAARRETKRETRGTAASHERHIYFKRLVQHHLGTLDATLADALAAAYWDGFIDEMTLCDGVHSVLSTLRSAGTSIAIVTNLTAHVQLTKLSRLGIDGQVDRLITSEEVGREKPSALPFTAGLTAFDCRPSEVLMVGDNVTADIAGANAIGMDTALFIADGRSEGAETPRDEHTRPDYRLDAFAALTEVTG